MLLGTMNDGAMNVDSVPPLLGGITSVLSAAVDDDHRQFHLADAAQRLAALGAAQPIVGERQPVIDDHLAAALSATDGAEPSFVEHVKVVAPHLHWVRSYPALEPGDPVMDRFVANYAYTVLAGPASDRWPRSPVVTDDIVVGLTLQAPGIYYPAHHHPAVELYGVVGGAGSWMRGADGWVTRRPGSAFVHAAGEAHAMETHDQPMLSWFVWLNDFNEPPVLT